MPFSICKESRSFCPDWRFNCPDYDTQPVSRFFSALKREPRTANHAIQHFAWYAWTCNHSWENCSSYLFQSLLTGQQRLALTMCSHLLRNVLSPNLIPKCLPYKMSPHDHLLNAELQNLFLTVIPQIWRGLRLPCALKNSRCASEETGAFMSPRP